MAEKAAQKEYTIDASGKRIGRVATEAAAALMGKHRPDFTRNKAGDTRVVISGADALDIPEAKRTGKIYTRYSGYPSGLKKEALGKLIERRGSAEVLRRAVYGMLPGNKLRPQRMKRLIIE